MKKSVCFFLLCLIPLTAIGNQAAPPAPEQQAPPRQPGPGKKFVDTPFGFQEVDISDPRPAVVVGPPAPPPAGPAAAQPTPAAPQTTQADPVIPISLRFDNSDIYPVIRIITEALGLNYVIDPRVKGTVNLITSGDLRRSDLLPILETILKMNGATMVRVGNLYNIIPSDQGIRTPLEVQDSRLPVAPDDQIVLYILRMKYVPGSEMSRLLAPYLSEGASIVVNETGNVLLLADRRSNLRKLLEIVDIFDSNAFEHERVRLIALKNTSARNLTVDLQTIFAGYALSDKATAIRFVPIERLNSVLVVTPNEAVFPEIERWIERLDQQPPPSASRNFVYRVRNGKAADIQRVLAELYLYTSPSASAVPPTGVAPAAPSGPSGAPPTPSPAPAQQGPGSLSSLTSAQEQVRIITDEVNNQLVIQASPSQYAEIERTLQQLDVVGRQVLIDAQIYEVVLSHDLSLGISAFLQNRATVNPQTTGSFGSSGVGPPSLTVQTFAFVGRNRELLAFLNAQENRSRVRTLSAPSVLVRDNAQAQFQVGAEIPVPTSSSITPVQSGGTNLFAQTINFRDTGVILRVKPQIGDGGRVSLEISQEVSQAGANTTSSIVAPVIGKSAVQSTIAVQDGETIALSGFIRENTDSTRNRIPLLGDIPGVGVLFGNTSRSTTRTELIVLITPHVIRSDQEANAATDELKTRLKEVRQLIK